MTVYNFEHLQTQINDIVASGVGGGVTGTANVISAEVIPQYTMVYADATTSGYVRVGEYNETKEKANVFGMIINEGGLSAFAEGELQLFGKITNPAWNWSPNTDLWLSTSGTLTVVQPDSAGIYAVPCGHSLVDPTEIWLNPQTGWRIGASSITAAGPLVRGAVEGRFGISSATGLVWTPDTGNGIGLWNGYEWRFVTPYTNPTATNAALTLSGVSLVVNSLYDVFAEWDSDDNFNFVFRHWDTSVSGSSSRGYSLYQHQGVYVHSDTTDGLKRRWLGTLYTYNNSSTVNFKDEAQYRFIANYYNEVNRVLNVNGTSPGWYTYNSSTWRPFYGDTSKFVAFVLCQTSSVKLETALAGGHTASANSSLQVNIGVDSTSTINADILQYGIGWQCSTQMRPYAFGYPVLSAGYHVAYSLERSSVNGVTVNMLSTSDQSKLKGVIYNK